MVDDGHAVIAIPAVQLHTPASLQQHLAVQLHGRFALQLVACQVGVVRGGDVIVR